MGTDLFTAPLTADDLAWSPVDDRLLYRNWLIGGGGGIFLTSVGGGAGTRLVDDGGALWVMPAWLPDGSGFVYTQDDTLHEYSLSSGQSGRLAQFYNEYVSNPSVSPDGQYVVFERQTTGTPIRHDLWILNRGRPAEMWELTQDGRSSNPDWSRTDPTSGYRVYVPYVNMRDRAQTTQILADLR
jgi:Tol biopolymer transport system component